jgi:ketosteroid isomerase-like protein
LRTRKAGRQSAVGSRQSTTQIKPLLEAHLNALNAHDLEKLVSFYADDAVLEFPASPPAQGIDRIRLAFQSFFDQWEEASTYRTIVVSGTTAAVEGTARGHHRTLHLRIPGRVAAGSREYRHDFAMFVEFVDGKIRRHRVYFDARDLVKQLLG